MTVLTSQRIEFKKTVWRTFLFCIAHISAWENDNIGILFLKDVPSKALQKPYEQIPNPDQKDLPNISIALNTVKSSTRYHVGGSF